MAASSNGMSLACWWMRNHLRDHFGESAEMVGSETMKTGRRAWRKWAKSRRHNASRAGFEWCEGSRKCALFGLHVQDMKNRAKPFTPRSLVGMTMGAKKRAAWYEAVRAGAPPIRSNRKLRLCLKWLPQGVLNETVPLQCRLTMRAKYRIGQRLRPCPGCSLCQRCSCGQPSACVGLYDPLHVSQKPEPACNTCCGHGGEDGWCKLRPYHESQCDGSGVLPARKAVDTATCEGFDGPCNAADAELRSSRTMYHWDGKGKNPNRPRMLCDECYRSYTAYWDEMWAQVNGEWPRVRSAR